MRMGDYFACGSEQTLCTVIRVVKKIYKDTDLLNTKITRLRERSRSGGREWCIQGGL